MPGCFYLVISTVRCRVFFLARIEIKGFKEAERLSMSMPWIGHRQGLAGCDVERCVGLGTKFLASESGRGRVRSGQGGRLSRSPLCLARRDCTMAIKKPSVHPIDLKVLITADRDPQSLITEVLQEVPKAEMAKAAMGRFR